MFGWNENHTIFLFTDSLTVLPVDYVKCPLPRIIRLLYFYYVLHFRHEISKFSSDRFSQFFVFYYSSKD